MPLLETLAVQCPSCQTHVNVHNWQAHVCPWTQPYRFSQVSHYNSSNNLVDLIKMKSVKQVDRQEHKARPSLPEILANRRNQYINNPNTEQQICARCRHSKATITIAQKHYHIHCFSCFYCRSPFHRNIPKVYQGQIYCLKHYVVAMQKPDCATCGKTIETFVRPTIALNHYFHPEHIRCSHCLKPVDPYMTGIKRRKGRIYCQTDYNRLFLPSCQACHRAVEKDAVNSKDGKLNGSWHKHCFKCQFCNSAFPDNRFYIYNNAPCCKLDYHTLNHSLCHQCNLPVEGECAETSNGWRFHPACFTCHICKSNIHDVYYIKDNQFICCQDHHQKN